MIRCKTCLEILKTYGLGIYNHQDIFDVLSLEPRSYLESCELSSRVWYLPLEQEDLDTNTYKANQ